MKKTDKIIVYTALFLLLFVIAYVASRSFVPAIIIAILLSATITVSARHILSRYGKTKKLSVARMEEGLAFLGIAKQNELFLSLLPQTLDIKATETYFIYAYGGKKTAVFPCYKFLPCGKDDIARFFKHCQAENVNDCKILCKQSPRELLLFAGRLPLNIEFVNSKKTRDFLVLHNATHNVVLPEKEKPNAKKKLDKKAFYSFFSRIITKERAKYFFISGISLVFACVVSPLKVYYLIFAVITLSLAIACYIKGAG